MNQATLNTSTQPLTSEPLETGYRWVQANQYHLDSGRSSDAATAIVAEEMLRVEIAGAGAFNLMWTPTEPCQADIGYLKGEGILGLESLTEAIEVPEKMALAAGFCMSEGIISTLDDIASIAFCDKSPGVIRIVLDGDKPPRLYRKNVVISSSCGICSPIDIIDGNIYQLKPVGRRLRLPWTKLLAFAATMETQQKVFTETGATHAALLFDPLLQPCYSREDLGRHNALDKVVGMSLMNNRTLAGCGLVLSSRISTELVIKSIRCGIELIAGVSAPTSMAVQLADQHGVTLCGFLRGDRLTVYTHKDRFI